MEFARFVEDHAVVLTEGSIIERVRRSFDVALDPHIENTGLVFDDRGRDILTTIYREYLDVGRDTGMPMIMLTPTWRANPERLARAGIVDVKVVHGECFDLVSSIRTGYGGYASSVPIGGLMGCRGDAYRPEEALGIDEAELFHSSQVEALSEAGVDFLLASTLPARTEAVGIAKALARSGLPYIPSFIVRPDATLLDGSPLCDVIEEIDSTVDPSPVFYMMNCIHPAVYIRAHSALESEHAKRRVLGLQANASPKTPEELDNLDRLDAADPDDFGGAMIDAHQECGAKILGGCCGTDSRHIRSIARKLA